MKKLFAFIFIVCLSLLNAGSLAQIGPIPGMGPFPFSACNATPILLTSGSGTWSNTTGCSNFKVEAIAGGASGGAVDKVDYAGGAGGGAYSQTNSVSIGALAYYSVGATATAVSASSSQVNGNAGNDTWLNNTTNAAPAAYVNGVLAKGGSTSAHGNTPTAAQGGQSGSGVGTLLYSGGNSGGSCSGGVGGGGAAGPHGVGGNGVCSATVPNGGQGDNGFGGAAGLGSTSSPAGNGGNGTEFDASHGSGGGGGSFASGSSAGTAGSGGNYGAGGGSCTTGGNSACTSGAGIGGIIRITPLSMASPANDNNPEKWRMAV